LKNPIRHQGHLAPIWGEPPPPPKVRKYERFLVYPGKQPPIIIVSSELHELKTHYVDGRTVLCTQHDGPCWLDHKIVGNFRYGGWLAIRHPSSPKSCLLCLTPVAVTLEPRLRDMRGDLRGLTLHVWREGNHIRSEMQARLLLDVPRVQELAPEPDVKFAVMRMLQAADRPDGVNKQKYGAFTQHTGAAAEKHAADLGRQGVEP
jgi:hypothetical protein